MTKFNIHEAKTQLSQLVDRALSGEEVIVARHGRALVRLVPVGNQAALRPIGLHRQPLSDGEAQEAMRPLSEEELADWYGS